ncbi:MAG TPA: hypothetical protein VIF57_16670, partial [Polyangia bacterium]
MPAVRARIPAIGGGRFARGALAVALLAGGVMGGGGCGADPAVRSFPDRPVAWQEHDSEDLPKAPRPTDLGDLDSTLTARDDLAGEADRLLSVEGARPARDVNAADEVPCSTWFCPRNHLRPMTTEAIAAGPAGAPPRLPLRIIKGKDRGAALGFQVLDADGRKFMLKLDPAGHLGMSTAAEIVGTRMFHAAGYNVPSNFVLDLRDEDLTVDPGATYKLYGVKKRPLTEQGVRQRLARAARTADGRLRAVAVTWLGGKVLGAFDMLGRRADDPNDRIAHQERRSLRSSWILAAWLAVYDASALNTLDSYVEEDGRHFVRHYLFDFGAGLGSATSTVKGPADGQQYSIEVGRSLASLLTLGIYQRRYQSQRGVWFETMAAHPRIGWFPAEAFDVESFRTNRKGPAYKRMTDRDAYWGAKLVTSFTDAQIEAAVGAAELDPRDAAYIARALGVRRDIIGRRYLTAVTAVEAPVIARGGVPQLCFDDLAVARGYDEASRVHYHVQIGDERGRLLADRTVTAQGPRSCVSAPEVA